jgi:putative SOS response-associated peptidase YedK
MIVLLRESDYDDWLDAPAERSMDFMRPCPPEGLVAVPEASR